MCSLKITKLTFLSPVILSFALSACGGGGNGESTPTEPPQPTNISPTVNAGSDNIVDENSSVSLSGTATDSDGSIVSYLWTQTEGTDALLTDVDTDTLSFTTPNIIENETLSFTLTATDNDGATASDSVSVLVTRVNSAPLVSLGEDVIIDEYTEVSLVGVASDEDGNIASYSFSQTSGPTILSTSIASPSINFTPPESIEIQIYTFELTVTDNDGLTASDSIMVKVNKPPTVNVGEDIVVDSGVIVNLSGLANDIDGNIASYYWTQTSGPVVSISDSDSSMATFMAPTVTADEVLVFSLTVTDSDGKAVTDSLNVKVSKLPPGITGKITYDKIKFSGEGYYALSLDVENPVISPTRYIVVQLLDLDELVVAQTVTDSNGVYTFPLELSSNDSSFTIKALAKLEIDSQIDDGFNIIVTDQSTATNLEDQSVYSVSSDTINYTKGSITFDMHLTAGWDLNTVSFDPTKSEAQPFSILDTLLNTANYLINAGIEFNDSLDVLYVNWTRTENSSERDGGFYSPQENRIFLNGDLSKVTDFATGSAEPEKYPQIEEWNDETIAHEFGHFYMKKILGRDDTTGGSHRLWSSMTLSSAFSEGLANAISYGSRGEWTNARTPYDVIGEYGFDDLYEIAKDPENCHSEGITWDGRVMPESCYATSLFNEATNTLFMMSLIDNKAETNWTAELEDEIGMSGLHQALQKVVLSEASTSIYSLTNELKELFPDSVTEIDALGTKLNINFVDEWGSDQEVIASELVSKDKALPSEAYLPIHLNVQAGDSDKLCFNGGTFSLSDNRAGTFHLVKFTAAQDGMVTVKVPDATDTDSNTHTYRVSANYKGITAESSLLFPNGNLDELEFMAKDGQTYVIGVEGQAYANYQMEVDETVCTSVSITQQ